MKKFLLLSLLIGSAILSYGQVTVNSAAVAGGNIATCNFAAGTPQSCVHICRNSVQISGGAVGDLNPRTISFDWYQVTSGNKSMHVVITCEGNIIFETCINVSDANQNELWRTTFSNVVCANKNSLTLRVQAWTNGTCSSNECGPLLISTGGFPLPVTLSSFTATRSSSNVLVKWQTSSEKNSDGFAIERNINGVWTEVGFVPSQAVGGSSDGILNYSFVDANNLKGIAQYRIRQVDFDAKFTYSEVRSVRGLGQAASMIVYPNPSNDGKLNITFSEGSGVRNVSVMDMSGRTVKQINGITNNNITVENLMPGIYTVRVSVPETGEQDVQKVVVNKR